MREKYDPHETDSNLCPWEFSIIKKNRCPTCHRFFPTLNWLEDEDRRKVSRLDLSNLKEFRVYE